MKIETGCFTERHLRAEYVARRFSSYFQGKILDVGCDKAYLKSLIPAVEYTGVDIGGTPDLFLNLDKIEKLPFPDDTFDVVVCTDVLEHLDQLHLMFEELIRVAKGVVILSLPNCWAGARVPIQRGRGSFAHYGLPVEKPLDRHKWFFSFTQIRDFLEGQSKRLPFTIESMHATEKKKPAFLKGLRKIRYPSEEAYLNRYANTLWAVVKKGKK